MNNSDLMRGLSSSTVQIFGVALIVLIIGLTTERTLARPFSIVAAGVLLAIALHWASLAIGRHHHR